MTKVLAISFLILCCYCLSATETNQFFVTTLVPLYGPDNLTNFIPIKIINSFKNVWFSLPAEKCPEGNWGAPQAGFQLSLQINKSTFTNGESIVAQLLLRNVTNHKGYYDFLHVRFGDGPVSFDAEDSKGNVLKLNDGLVDHIEGPHNGSLMPGSQVWFFERVDKRYNFSNDTFTVQAKILVGDLEPEMPIYSPMLDTNVEWKPMKDAHGIVTNVDVRYGEPKKRIVVTVKSAPVKISVRGGS
jgi:hypothetical protein